MYFSYEDTSAFFSSLNKTRSISIACIQPAKKGQNLLYMDAFTIKIFFLSFNVKRDLKDWDISKELALDRSAWRLSINVPEP